MKHSKAPKFAAIAALILSGDKTRRPLARRHEY